MGKKFKHLTYNDRLKIEALLLAGNETKVIAEIIGVHVSTINREKKRGRYTHLRSKDWKEEERYSPEQAEEKYRKHLKEKGAGLKIEKDENIIPFLEKQILEKHYSPYAALQEMKKVEGDFETTICLSTCYNYIRNDIFPNIELSDLPYKRQKKKKQVRSKVQKRASKGTSIEKRPEHINEREDIGHWEMDTVVGPQGKSNKSLLVLTERKTRFEIIELMNRHTTDEVIKGLNRIERKLGEKRFREIFLSITVDNGMEFSNVEGIEASRRNKKKRTEVYYCHPYSSYERGTNENQNRLVRRHIPKGMNFDHYTNREIKEIQQWINAYPRQLFNGKTAQDLFYEELQAEEWRAAG